MGIFGNNNNIYDLGKKEAEEISENIGKSFRILNEIISEELSLVEKLFKNIEDKKTIERLVVFKGRKDKCLGLMKKGIFELEKITISAEDNIDVKSIFSSLVLTLSNLLDKILMSQNKFIFIFKNLNSNIIQNYAKDLSQQQKELELSQEKYLYAYETSNIGRVIKSISKMSSKFARKAAIVTLAGGLFYTLGNGNMMLEDDFSQEMFRNRMIFAYVAWGIYEVTTAIVRNQKKK